MKKNIITLNLLFIVIIIAGQSKIVFDEYLMARTDRATLQWTINGVTFNPTTDGVIIYPHEKGMDTIIYQEIWLPDSETKLRLVFDTIISKIPNNQELIMTVGCCDYGFDLIKNDEKRKQALLLIHSLLDENKLYELDSLRMTLFGFETIKFEILNKPISDTLICDYGGVFHFGQMITIKKDYGWVKPCRSSESDNNISVCIMKLNKNINFEIIKDDEFECAKGIDIVEWNAENWEKDLEILKKFRLRLFDNEKVIIQYDYLTNMWWCKKP